MSRPIAISLSPNAEKDDVLVALKSLFLFHKWFDDSETRKLEDEFASRFGPKYKALAINSGRSAEYIILKALGIGEGDEVALQAFTCIAVPNSVLWLKAKPMYVDIDSSLNMDPQKLRKMITRKTKAVIVQHTFGVPASLDMIRKITRDKKVFMVEDCAHSLGAKYDGEETGTFGDVSFFSFGRDKVISSIFGGVILCADTDLYLKMKSERDKLKMPSRRWIFQQLLHPIAFSLILPLYNLYFGKLILFLLQKLNLLSRAVYAKEKKSQQPKEIFPTKMPGVLARLARNQLKKLDSFNAHRTKIADIYKKSLRKGVQIRIGSKSMPIWLRFPVLVGNRNQLYDRFKSRGILLGDWYKEILSPSRQIELFGYKLGSCEMAEKYSKEILNLPTYPLLTIDQAVFVSELLKKYEI